MNDLPDIGIHEQLAELKKRVIMIIDMMELSFTNEEAKLTALVSLMTHFTLRYKDTETVRDLIIDEYNKTLDAGKQLRDKHFKEQGYDNMEGSV